ncbi:hypothetical protein [Ornithinimicrobium murale]|uniref:hypothetical protein n=1 Tax=Ornithinimicrobium murale TaxID=1050153 RepID=UPI0013B35F7A|nr:hypothetical protein [Ornithinimicrobium murale]
MSEGIPEVDEVVGATREELTAAQRSAAKGGHQVDEALGVAAKIIEPAPGWSTPRGWGTGHE